MIESMLGIPSDTPVQILMDFDKLRLNLDKVLHRPAAFRHYVPSQNGGNLPLNFPLSNKNNMKTKSKKFRDDINGLRAWAVLAVILFHFGVPGFSGGFVGVDIFFVISGFLMTGIVVEGLEKNHQKQFSIIEFYMARARRILPALIVLCAVLLALGWLTLLPLDYKMLGTHVVSAIFFLSNVQFWREAGYFDTSSHDKWLLHTWSLSVEWQFYLILPLVIIAVWKLWPGRKSVFNILLAGLLASLALSIVVSPLAPSAAFYLLPTRAWEMLAGGLVYLLANRLNMTEGLRTVFESIGFALIAWAILGFDSSSNWPGWRALVPVVGTMLVLFAARSNSRWTGLAVTQWLGTRSYSLYLWHWPIVVALTYWGEQTTPGFIAAGLGLTLVLGHLSYHMIESSTRRHLGSLNLRKNSALLLSCILITTAASTVVIYNNGLHGRLDPEAEVISQESLNSNPRRDECLIGKGIASPSCEFGGSDLQAIVLGDSHANAVVSAVVSATPSPNSGVMELSYSACPTIQGVHGLLQKQCGDFVDWAIEKLKTIPKNIPVVIINRHAQFVYGPNEDASKANKPQVYFSKPYKTPEPEFLEEYAKNLTNTACQLAQDRTVYLVRPIPEMGVNVPMRTARTVLLGIKQGVYVTHADYQQRQAFIWQAQDAARDQCGVKILDPLPYLCSDGRCYGAKNNRPLYRDSDHLSEHGNKVLVPMFAEIFMSSDTLIPQPMPSAALPH